MFVMRGDPAPVVSWWDLFEPLVVLAGGIAAVWLAVLVWALTRRGDRS